MAKEATVIKVVRAEEADAVLKDVEVEEAAEEASLVVVAATAKATKILKIFVSTKVATMTKVLATLLIKVVKCMGSTTNHGSIEAGIRVAAAGTQHLVTTSSSLTSSTTRTLLNQCTEFK